MSLRRGFKAEAERISAESRSEMKLSCEDLLDPFALAHYLCIPILGLRKAAAVLGKPEVGRYFLSEDVDTFSALTLFQGRKRVIIHNDAHSATRQASNIAHELSHCLLEHQPEPILRSDGSRCWNEQVEAEATWLGGALLVPRSGALELARSGLGVEEIARHFAVSPALCRWRINETGIYSQLQRYAGPRRATRKAAAR